jgi:hypothetical protein
MSFRVYLLGTTLIDIFGETLVIADGETIGDVSTGEGLTGSIEGLMLGETIGETETDGSGDTVIEPPGPVLVHPANTADTNKIAMTRIISSFFIINTFIAF